MGRHHYTGVYNRISTSKTRFFRIHSFYFLASWKGDKDVVEFLTKNGADVNLADEKGKTPLNCGLYRVIVFSNNKTCFLEFIFIF